MTLERQLLQFIAQRGDMLMIYPTTRDIFKQFPHDDVRHDLHALHIRGLVMLLPFRKWKGPKRYQITQAGRELLRKVAA